MTSDSDVERLPKTLGGLVDFAFAAYASRARLYVGLAVIAFALQALLEYALPAAKLGSDEAAMKLIILDYASILIDAFIIAAVAAGTATYAARSDVSTGRITATAVERWLPVIVVGLLAQTIAVLTAGFNGFNALPDPPWVAIVTAPACWLALGIVSLGAPFAVLSARRASGALFDGLYNAISVAFTPANAGRIAVIAFAGIAPSLLQAVALDAGMRAHWQRPFFWANVPIDALTVAPLAALQTAFVLDFARRAGRLRTPPEP